MLTERDVDKLAKILGLLGSRHPGEVAAAGHKATQFLKERGWQWIDVLKLPALPKAASNGAESDLFSDWQNGWRGAVQFCLQHSDRLTRWERTFCEKVADWYSISSKQRPILAAIASKLMDAGYRP
jgi:hypothetical protein